MLYYKTTQNIKNIVNITIFVNILIKNNLNYEIKFQLLNMDKIHEFFFYHKM